MGLPPDPRRAGRPGSASLGAGQSLARVGVPACGVVIEHDMQRTPWPGDGHHLQELKEFLVAAEQACGPTRGCPSEHRQDAGPPPGSLSRWPVSCCLPGHATARGRAGASELAAYVSQVTMASPLRTGINDARQWHFASEVPCLFALMIETVGPGA